MIFNFPYGFDFLHSSELLLLFPLALLVLLGHWKKINKKHLFFHALVGFLLILALAVPYSAEMSSPKTNQTGITIISDESASMELLKKGISEEISEKLGTRVPVTVTTVSGIHTSLGDAIIQQASPDNYVLVVSDGQSNSGTPVEEALSYCYKNNFPVAALIPKTEKEDLSVEIEGDNEAVIDNDAFYKVNIRKATAEKMSYQVRITVDHQKVMEREITQTGRIESIEFNHTFETLGPHTVKATLHPASISVKNLDYFKNNNQYMKSIYVTPKPEVLLVTNEPDSPLANTMKEIYNVKISGSYGSLNGTDAVIIDNQAASTISDSEARALRNYVINGGGMVVVGGGSSFDFPAEKTYQNTEFEELLPVTSKPSNWRGGRNIVLMLDVSPSTLQSNGVGGRVLDDILSNAIVLLESDLLKDARVDVITFGSKGQDVTDGFVDMSKESNRLWLDSEIRKIKPTGDSTSLERGLMTSRTLLNGQNKSAEAEIIIVSDGGIGNDGENDNRFERAVQCAENLHKSSGIGIHFVHIHAPKTTRQVTPKGQYYAALLMNKIGLSENYNRIEPGQRMEMSFSENPEEFEAREDEYSSGSIVIYDPQHFITRNISDINHDILGYNEVTPKPEANRIVITRLGKPVITTWRLGLGRVAAITTDNGNGNGIPWAASLYSGNDSLIITRTLNWAVADPEMSEDIQLKVPDLKMNQPGRILITTGKEGTPELYFDKKPMEITSIGNNMYESYVTADTFGLHKISETPVDINLTEELMPETFGAKNVSWRPAAVNRPDEYTYIGENSLFRTAILENGGKIYTTGDVYSRIIEDASTRTEKQILTKVFYTKYFLALAFLIYLLYTLHHTYNTRMK
ncbi:MAG: VWA domain-containing protein [Methanosarcina sp.]|uniref:vWA domain-containing protein n=1 Tax=Methanosarcina sp. TaxID=2213 RepID=UPI00261B869B|nr:VWA domain-containing protein [Methanosarcina sp.]MDD3246030.1 VWA domain-containing protein [Methanosarcina sp.]MDD4249648.1 VWA domain-containing protein [Methanosarcina sp.]